MSSSGSIGSLRIRLPVAAKMALVSAGASPEVPGSPMPPGASLLATMWVSMTGVSFIRTTRTSWKFDCSMRPSFTVALPQSAPEMPKITPL